MKVRKLISIVAASGTPVLILGETGVGKEVVARAIHDRSGRVGNPFVTINASALQESILESELFGYRRGAFTGAQANKLGLLEIAHNGTFFIDEVGDMGISIQAKILRALETGAFMKLGDTKETRVDTRFIFATNKDLKSRIDEGLFRKDLFFRINGFTITLPPLRERRATSSCWQLLPRKTQQGERQKAPIKGRDRLAGHLRMAGQREGAGERRRAFAPSQRAARGDRSR